MARTRCAASGQVVDRGLRVGLEVLAREPRIGVDRALDLHHARQRLIRCASVVERADALGRVRRRDPDSAPRPGCACAPARETPAAAPRRRRAPRCRAAACSTSAAAIDRRKNGEPSSQEHGERRQQHQHRPPHHPGGDAVPHAVEGGDPPQRQSPGVDARSERHQQRGQEGERGDDGQQDDDHAAEAHRREERALEEEQAPRPMATAKPENTTACPAVSSAVTRASSRLAPRSSSSR